MLKKILSISGKPGLHTIVSTNKSISIVESLIDGKRFPVHSHDKAVSLADISIYTDENEEALVTVFTNIKNKEEGKIVSLVKEKPSNNVLFEYFAEVLPNFDRERVYPSDVKKILSWYNLLTDKGICFESEEVVSEEPSSEEKE